MDIISLFSGCGGLDLGFKNAGFNIVWANDYATSVWETYSSNHKGTFLSKEKIQNISSPKLPNQIIGIIGGPPCQSWSVAGEANGLNDPRGKLFFEYIRILKDKNPLFFLAENVPGMLLDKHKKEFNTIIWHFRNAGYSVTVNTLNSIDFNVPQNRERVFFIGYRKDIGLKFNIEKALKNKLITVKDSIFDLKDSALPGLPENKTNGDKCFYPNHEFYIGGFSYIFMSRNRVLEWSGPSYTIQADGRQISIHPNAPKMVKIKKDVMIFVPGQENLYRRLSVRECARIQTFPDNFIFNYTTINSAYRMIGNAVPVNLAEAIAKKIKSDLFNISDLNNDQFLVNKDIKILQSIAS